MNSYPEHLDILMLLGHIAAEEHEEPTYLEMGIGGGEVFNLVGGLYHCAVGVDIRDLDGNEAAWCTHPNAVLYGKVRTDDWVASGAVSDHEYTFVFIDAWHEKEQVLRDFWGVFPHVVEGGYLVLHDTYPPGESHLGPDACNNAWEAAWELSRRSGEGMEVLTLSSATHCGYTVIRKRTKQCLWMVDG
jgi:hypothetical protein